MKLALVAILFGCLSVGIASIAFAGDNDQAGIAAHITPSGSQNCVPPVTAATLVTGVNDGLGCDEGVGTSGQPRWDVWLLVCNGSDSTGVRGVEFGIDYAADVYTGIYVNNWQLCADQDFPETGFSPDTFNQSGPAGNTVTWLSCQDQNSEPFVPQTVIAVMGALDVFTYDPDVLSIVAKQNSGKAEVADCSGDQESILGNSPSHLGFSEWCLGAGYNPCGLPTAVEPKTWGAIKKLSNGE